MATIGEIKNATLHQLYPKLYGQHCNNEHMDVRYIALIEQHHRLFGEENPSLFSTAGRTELGGNHTDHNLGKVLAATINLDTIAAVTPRSDSKVILDSEGYPRVEVDLHDLAVREEEKNTTEALVRGIAHAFSLRGLTIGGWQANTTSNVLKGSGLSSSAAVEILCGTIFNHLYNKDVLTPVDLATIGKYSENTYFGKPSGLMDQMACAYGGIIGIDFKNEANPEITPVSYSFAEHGYNLVIVDTGGNHADLTPEYASVPKEMRQVASVFGKTNLRDVGEQAFMEKLPELRKTLQNDRCLLRAIHFFQENKRVDTMLACLKEHDMEGYLKAVSESGESSFCFLQNLYPSFHPQEQGLSLAIATTKAILGDDATVRVHGGGFAGTIQAYVPDELLAPYTKRIKALFGAQSVTIIAIRSKETCCIAD
ncbi:MAG: galactokinase [Spirochaetales bacterium]|nr:galactokinase [Spirochaetales bacterium]